jgi:hypothetical protein
MVQANGMGIVPKLQCDEPEILKRHGPFASGHVAGRKDGKTTSFSQELFLSILGHYENFSILISSLDLFSLSFGTLNPPNHAVDHHAQFNSENALFVITTRRTDRLRGRARLFIKPPI